MRKLLLLVCFISSAYVLFGQTNKYKDEKLLKQKERKYIIDHKIKEVDMQIINVADSLSKSAQLFQFKVFYNKDGFVIRSVEYMMQPSKEHPEGEITPRIINYDHEFDRNKNETKVNTWGTLNIDHQTSIYEYDDKGNLMKETNDSHMMIMYGHKKIGGIDTYTNDEHGNVVFRRAYDLDGEFVGVTEFVYDKNDRLIKSYSYKGATSQKGNHEEYTYTLDKDGLTKVQNVYNDRDSLIIENELVYNQQGNQTRGYEIKNGVKRLVWDYKYDTKGRVIESTGGPDPLKYLSYKDIRRDGLAHLFYAYDNDGKLITIKKYEKDILTGKEKLSATETLTYNN